MLLKIIHIGGERRPEHELHGVSLMWMWLGLFLTYEEGSGENSLLLQGPRASVVSCLGSGLALILSGS